MLKFFSTLVVVLIGGILYLHYGRGVPMPFMPDTPETAFERGKHLTQAYCIPSDDDDSNNARGMKALTYAAQQGHIEAAAVLGNKLLGQGNYTEAFKWLELAAEHDWPMPAGQLCGYHYAGSRDGTLQKDYTKALKWCSMAAKFNYFNAHKTLAAMYADGSGVAQDYERAYYWSSLANYWSVDRHDLGYSPEQKNVIAAKLTPEKTKVLDDEVRKWSPKPWPEWRTSEHIEHCKNILAEKREKDPIKISDDVAKQCLERCISQVRPPDQRFLKVKECPYWTWPHQDMLVQRSTGEINTWP